ncbi:protein kinase C-binding protein 1-like [Contarinia nasturtii]|uniref:protein kinase C-binding protein 1-like n=1 Tax=Contarinia nasturtii TaxID=265458 RepID=UPI0012D3D823|nr:protein kinase C-binding protein 1-like [Contarinia nasturtii]
MAKHDEYCWKCKKRETTIKCKSCTRSFHFVCTGASKLCEPKTWSCDICNTIESSTNTPEELERIPVIIHRLLNSKFEQNFLGKKVKASKSTKSSGDESSHETNSKTDILNSIVMDIKRKANTYANFEQLLADVEQIVHKCETSDNRKSKYAKELLENFNGELDSVKICIQCHINANNRETRSKWFTMACDKPHLIVWAQKPNERYLPGKVMCVNRHELNVRFFGGSQLHRPNADIPFNKCYLYTKENPFSAKNDNQNAKSKYAKALNEAEKYIRELKDKFGAFNFEEVKTQFNPELHDQYVQNMIKNNETGSPSRISNRLGSPIDEHLEEIDETIFDDFSEDSTEETMQTSSDEQYDENPPDQIQLEPVDFKIEDCIEGYGGPSAKRIRLDNNLSESNVTNNNLQETESSSSENNGGPSYLQSLQHVSEGFMKLEQSLKEANEKIQSMEKEHQEILTELKAVNKRGQLKLVEDYEQKIRELNEQIDMRTNELAEKDQEYKNAIEEAKKNKYCLECDKPELLTDIYLCTINCVKKFGEAAEREKSNGECNN